MSFPTSETLAVLDKLHLLLSATRAYGSQHPSAEAAAAALALAIRDALPPFALQFVVGAAFRDRELLPIDGERYDRMLVIGDGLHKGGAQEVVFHGGNSEELVVLSAALLSHREHLLDDLGLTSVSFREIPDASPGQELETVEPEIFVAAQLVLGFGAARACAEASSSITPQPWSFANGMEAVRRLERAMETNASVTAYTLEIAPGTIDPGRRALMAAHHVRVVANCLGTSKSVARASAHAALMIAACGLAPRGGSSFDAAVAKAAACSVAGLEVASADPHRVLVTTLLHDQSTHARLPIGALLRLAYEIELERCPVDVDFDLGLADVLSSAVSKWNHPGSSMAAWVRVRVAAAGVMPAGARVRLADGRRGIVLGPGASGDPMLPMVLVDGLTFSTLEPPVIEGTPQKPGGVPAEEPRLPVAVAADDKQASAPIAAPASLGQAALVTAATPSLAQAAPAAETVRRVAGAKAHEPASGARGRGARRDPRRDTTGPRLAPVSKEALALFADEPAVGSEPKRPTNKPLRREDG
jgi:hypothetical protein